METLRVIEADLADPAHAAAVLAMTRAYARDPMGNGRELPDDVARVLIDRLRAHPTTRIFLALDAVSPGARMDVGARPSLPGLDGARPVGIATCFVGFSTFTARPVVNVHDLHVAPTHQRRGIGGRLLDAVEAAARAIGATKLTLEVQEHNRPALALYARRGFVDGQYEPEAGRVLFREKRL